MSSTVPIAVQAVSGDAARQRRQAVATAIDRVRVLEREHGVTRAMLERVKAVILELAARRELFPGEDFPLPDGKSVIYRLAEDADHRFALYMSCGAPNKRVPPHNHTTWAVIAGVEGEEENYFHERTDDGSVPGRGTLKRVREQVVRPGSGVCLMPEDIHHIQTPPHRPNRTLHLYGLSLEHLPRRVSYDLEAGTYQVFPANPSIVPMQ